VKRVLAQPDLLFVIAPWSASEDAADVPRWHHASGLTRSPFVPSGLSRGQPAPEGQARSRPEVEHW
jgi:hypothetical protein